MNPEPHPAVRRKAAGRESLVQRLQSKSAGGDIHL